MEQPNARTLHAPRWFLAEAFLGVLQFIDLALSFNLISHDLPLR